MDLDEVRRNISLEIDLLEPILLEALDIEEAMIRLADRVRSNDARRRERMATWGRQGVRRGAVIDAGCDAWADADRMSAAYSAMVAHLLDTLHALDALGKATDRMRKKGKR